jgi:hypothetical protein
LNELDEDLDEPQQNKWEALKEALPVIAHVLNVGALLNILIAAFSTPPIIEAVPMLLMCVVLFGAAIFKIDSKKFIGAFVFICASFLISFW